MLTARTFRHALAIESHQPGIQDSFDRICQRQEQGMDHGEFWAIIEQSRRATESCEQTATHLEDILRKRSPDQIVAFAACLQDVLDSAYTWDLWGAAYIINSGCSDDGFEYFRGWLISQGRAVFEAAVTTPDSLAQVAKPDVECEDILYCPYNAWRQVTGSEDYPTPVTRGSREPRGTRWKDDDDLEARFPLLTKAFW